LSKGQQLFMGLLDTLDERWQKLPASYDRNQFPLRMLVEFLTDRKEWSSIGTAAEPRTIRRCDAAAKAIQDFTRKSFGFDQMKSEAEKDEAILKIQKWWRERPFPQ